VYATVTRNVEDAGLGPGDPLQDGDASTLPVGTPVYRIHGYAPTFRLIAHLQGSPEKRLLFYQVTKNPQAHVGADLLDIDGKVTSLDIYSGTDATKKLATLTDTPNQARLSELVSLVLAGSVDETRRESGDSSYILVFHLRDETGVAESYWMQDRWLFPGTVLAESFTAALQQAVGG